MENHVLLSFCVYHDKAMKTVNTLVHIVYLLYRANCEHSMIL